MNTTSEVIADAIQVRADIQRAIVRAAAEVAGISDSLMALALAGLASLPTEHGDLALTLARQDRIRVFNADARRRSHR